MSACDPGPTFVPEPQPRSGDPPPIASHAGPRSASIPIAHAENSCPMRPRHRVRSVRRAEPGHEARHMDLHRGRRSLAFAPQAIPTK